MRPIAASVLAPLPFAGNARHMIMCFASRLQFALLRNVHRCFFLILMVMNAAPGRAQSGVSGNNASGLAGASGKSSVDYNTGVLNYHLPLLSIGQNGAVVSVGLSYAARGIKVEQRPSAAGLGWNLTGIGVISRAVRGRVSDEAFSGTGMLNDTTSQAGRYTENYFNRVNSGRVDGESDIFSLNYNDLSIRFILKKINDSIVAIPLMKTNVRIKVEGGIALNGFDVTDDQGNRYYFRERETMTAYFKADAIPDNGVALAGSTTAWYLSKLRMYNGEEASFGYITDYISESGRMRNEIVQKYGRPFKEIIPSPQLLAQIENRVHQLELLNQENARYRGAIASIQEALKYQYWQYQSMNAASYQAVEHHTNDSTLALDPFFKYTNSSAAIIEGIVDSYYDDIRFNVNLLSLNEALQSSIDAQIAGLMVQLYQPSDVTWRYSNHPSLSFVRAKQIKTISVKNRQLIFNYRRGVYNNTVQLYLDNIADQDKTNNAIRSVALHFDPQDMGLLKSVAYKDPFSADSIQYGFNYYREQQLSVQFESTAQDYWGFYNGISNPNLIPSNPGYYQQSPAYPVFFANGTYPNPIYSIPDSIGKGNRAPDSLLVMARTLKEVLLPEGGSIGFEYEPNTAYLDGESSTIGVKKNVRMGGIRIKSIISKAGPGDSTRTNYIYEFFSADSSFRRSTGKYTTYGRQTFVFTSTYDLFTDDAIQSGLHDQSPNFSSVGNENVLYHYVEESRPGFGSIGYKYFNFPETKYAPTSPATETMALKYQYHWLEGLLLAKVQYDTLNNLVQLDKFNYYLTPGDVPGKTSVDKPVEYQTYFPDYFYNSGTFAFSDSITQVKFHPGFYDSLIQVSQYVDQDLPIVSQPSFTLYCNRYEDYFVPNILPRLPGFNRQLPMVYTIRTGGTVLPRKVTTYTFNSNSSLITSSVFPRKDKPYYFEWLLQGGLNASMVNEAVYQFDNPSHALPTRIERKTNNGERRATRNKYVLDYTIGANAQLAQLKALNKVTDIVESQEWLYQPGPDKWYLLSGQLNEFATIAGDTSSFVIPVKSYATELPGKIEAGVNNWNDAITSMPPYNALFHESQQYYRQQEQRFWTVTNNVAYNGAISKINNTTREVYSHDPFTGRLNAVVADAAMGEVVSIDRNWLKEYTTKVTNYRFFKTPLASLALSEFSGNKFLEKDCQGYASDMYQRFEKLRKHGSWNISDTLFTLTAALYVGIENRYPFQAIDSLYDLWKVRVTTSPIQSSTRIGCAAYLNIDSAVTFLGRVHNPLEVADLYNAVFRFLPRQLISGVAYEASIELATYKASDNKIKISGVGLNSIPIKVYYTGQSPWQSTIAVNDEDISGVRSTVFDPATIPNLQNATRLAFLLDNNTSFESMIALPTQSTFRYNIYTAAENIRYVYDHNFDRINYTYDWLGRTTLVRDKHGFIVKQICYNYAGQPVSCRLFYNPVMTQRFTRNNCTGGMIGREYDYTIPAGKYMGRTQREADSLAQRDIDLNGQNEANLHAACDNVLYNSAAVDDYFNKQSCSLPFYTAIPYHVTIAAGAYTSTISQIHANNLALQAAQNAANTNGQCEPAVFEAKLRNTTSTPMNFIITNQATSLSHGILVPAGVGSNPGLPAYLPLSLEAGVYTIEIFPVNTSLIYNVSAGCGAGGTRIGNSTFTTVTLHVSCADIRTF